MWIYCLLIVQVFIFLWQLTRKPKPPVNSPAPETTPPPPPPSAICVNNGAATIPIVYKHDVFLSFRGADTRFNLTSHLYAALRGRSILSYIDDVNLHRGADIVDSLWGAIEQSRMSVVVFSDNYADSGWCLDELVKIVHCLKNLNQVVLPVFYGMPPEDVRDQTGSYGVAFAKHRQSTASPEKLKMWRAALKEVAGIPGCESLKISTEAELVKTVVETVLATLEQISPAPQFPGLVGIHTRIDDIESLLHLDSDSETRVVGMWGMGGVGKTTLARAIFDQFLSKFEAFHFLGDFRQELERCSELDLQHELFSTLLGDEYNHHTAERTTNLALTYAKMRLARTRVLVVIDDVEDPVALHNLLDKQPRTLFGPGSRILVTSRDHQVLQNVCDEVYEAKGLNDYESLQLFASNAFKNVISDEFMELSWRAIRYPSGNPLALIVLAKALFGRSKDYWESILLRLHRGAPNQKVQNVLKISFDGLDRDEKNAFLDVACFYKGESRGHVKSMLDGAYGDGSSENIVTSLTDRALIGIAHDGLTIMIHDLLQEMGRGIVKAESDDPGKRSRLWDQNDVYSVLTRKEGTEKIKGISMELGKGQMQLDSDAFARMSRLRLLRFYVPRDGYGDYTEVQLPSEGLQFLSNQLTSLQWPHFPSNSLPPTFRAENLIDLRIPYSNVKHLWTGVQNLGNLKYIHLSYCINLVELPDLSLAKRIEDICVLGCESLVKIPSHVQQLESLANLNVWNCKSLPDLPTQFTSKSINSLAISAENCPTVANYDQLYLGTQEEEEQQEKEEEEQQQQQLDMNAPIGNRVLDVRNSLHITDLRLNGTMIQEIPATIELLTNLVLLDISQSKHLFYISTNICKLKKLEKLDLAGCLGLETFPEILEPMEKLTQLFLGGTSIKELPSSAVYNLVNNTALCLNNCRKLVRIPEDIQFFDRLTLIDIRDCESLVCLPKLPLRVQMLNADDCVSLNEFPDCSDLRELVSLRLGNCFLLDQDAIVRWMVNAFADVQRTAVEIYFPGSEIPHCFEFQSSGSEVTIQLPWNMDDLLYGVKGIAYCLVVEDDGSCSDIVENTDDMRLGKYSATIPPLQCNWETTFPLTSSSARLHNSRGTWYQNAFNRGFTQFKSDHLFITYRSRDHEREIFNPRNVGCDVSFRFEFTHVWKVKKVGVMIVEFDYGYGNDDDDVGFDAELTDWTAGGDDYYDDQPLYFGDDYDDKPLYLD
ncbi:unnamed protein product [Linum tenue]|uniref:ADP-ribosyl cyclase/cyclic ADP-ribose hydrolase n=1 Tax=Linum tenue TaxID=586396 RepID=A0AAV0M353_9ROSI|nr:unnamed protein product [Linum tenue]